MPVADMSLAPALVVLNPAARHGTGLARYGRVAGLLEARYSLSTVIFDREARWRDGLRQALDGGTRHVIAAGGDGTNLFNSHGHRLRPMTSRWMSLVPS